MKKFQTIAGEFAPQEDLDASVKFALNEIFSANRLKVLADLIGSDGELGAVEGEPGWILEKRIFEYDGVEEHIAWPKDAEFFAHVNPESYQLKYPTFYMTRSQLYEYIAVAIQNCLRSGCPIEEMGGVEKLNQLIVEKK